MERIIRCFICIDFPDEVIKEVARVQGLISKVKFTGKMTELENLHLTLKFLGEISEKRLEAVKDKLRTINFENLNLKLGRLGVFSHAGMSRIVWIKIEGAGIYELQKKVDEALRGDFKIEERFMGHLTVARIKYVKDPAAFVEHLDSIHPKSIDFSVKEFKLKESDLRIAGPVYTDLETYPSRG